MPHQLLLHTHVERACDLTRYHAQIAQGPFRLGYSAYIHSRLISILERLQFSENDLQSHPINSYNPDKHLAASHVPIRVVLESGTTIQLIDRVPKGEIHAAFGVQPMLNDELWIEPIMRESFCLCISKNHRLAKQPTVFARELDGEMLFFLPRAAHPGLYNRTLEYIESTGAKPLMREVLSFTHTMEIVAHNFGVALLPRSASHMSHTGVLFKPITDKLLWMETALFRRHDQTGNRTLTFLRELLAQIKNASLDR
ncbi:MAG: LysR family substrate-binding domain-containing protein [Acidobacteriaceae bacterium]